MECLEEMEDNLPREGHEPKLRPLETQHQQTSSTTYDLDLPSPSMAQQSSNKIEPLMPPAVSSYHSAASIDTGCEVLTRKPVLPLRPLSTSSIEQPGHSELNPLTSRDSNPEDAVKNNSLMAPKAFRKPHRYLGRNVGYLRRRSARRFSSFCILGLVTIFPLFFTSWGMDIVIFRSYSTPPFMYDCYQKGGGWSFVGINLIFGEFNYGSAKALDLAWNWIIGRGVQALLMLLVHRVFADALLRAAEMTPLSFELYAKLSLYTTSINVLWHLLKALFKNGNWRTKAIFVWLCISIIYVVSFPSLMDACSGYESAYNSFFAWPNSTLQSTDDFKTIDWYGSQFDATTMTILYSTVTVCTSFLISTDNGTVLESSFSYSLPNMTLVAEWSAGKGDGFAYACTYPDRKATYGPPGTEQMFGDMVLYYWYDETLNSTWWSHFQSDPLTSDYHEWPSWGFYPTNSSNFRCVPASGIYQWGFSSEWLFVVTVVNSCWLLGLCILWLDCDTNSELCKKGRRLGLWRAIADISEAMREELGPNICAYSEKELAEALKNRPPIKYHVKHGTEQEPGHIGLSTQSSGRVELRWDHKYGSLMHGKFKRRGGHENGWNEME